ncbi:MAG: hypothetical protein RL329_149 [Bacteroidota bacterium]
MKKVKFLWTSVLATTLLMSAQLLHEMQITVISPKTDVPYKKGQVMDIHFKVHCAEELKSVTYTITDSNDKVLFSKSPNVAGKNVMEEKNTWTITQTDPSVLTLSIEAKDIDGHGSNKVVQINANF